MVDQNRKDGVRSGESDISKCFYNITYCTEILNALLKLRICKTAVCHICKWDTESSQNLACGKKARTGCHLRRIPFSSGRSSLGPPDQNWNIQLFSQSGHPHILFRNFHEGRTGHPLFFSLKFSAIFSISASLYKDLPRY